MFCNMTLWLLPYKNPLYYYVNGCGRSFAAVALAFFCAF